MTTQLSFPADAALIDIEGTISPLDFVRRTLFGYSRRRIAEFVAAHAGDAQIEEILAQARHLAGRDNAIAALEDWQARDVKAPPLKALQGLIWEGGYSSGRLVSPIFADALDALGRWRAGGVRLYVYSSGSKKAQDLFFRHSEAGDLRTLFGDFFDTGVGPKSEPSSYLRIAEAIGTEPSAIVFFSDNESELRAAQTAGLQVAHVVKEVPAGRVGWPAVSDFSRVAVRPAS
jgi:enolase-phosphatase E1